MKCNLNILSFAFHFLLCAFISNLIYHFIRTYSFLLISCPRIYPFHFSIYEIIVISQADRNFSHFYMFYCIIALQIEILVV